MHSKLLARAVSSALLVSLCACGAGTTGSSMTPPASTGSMGTSTPSGYVPVMVSDDSAEDWATIGVKVLSIALTPAGGGSPVTVYTAPARAPLVNLEELDQLAEILG